MKWGVAFSAGIGSFLLFAGLFAAMNWVDGPSPFEPPWTWPNYFHSFDFLMPIAFGLTTFLVFGLIALANTVRLPKVAWLAILPIAVGSIPFGWESVFENTDPTRSMDPSYHFTYAYAAWHWPTMQGALGRFTLLTIAVTFLTTAGMMWLLKEDSQ